MKSTDPREQEIHSLAQQLRDCRELLNQTNQEFAALGGHAADLAESLGNLMASLGGREKECGHDFDCVCPQAKAAAALTNYRSAKQ